MKIEKGIVVSVALAGHGSPCGSIGVILSM